MNVTDRRGWLKVAGATLGGLLLTACDKFATDPKTLKVLGHAEGLTRRVQRLVIDRKAMAREFSHADISSDFRANGSINPPDEDYRAHLAKGFADYRLVIDGLVEKPLSLSLTDLRAQPSRTQITRHDCVEGWSSIGKWTGARLGPLLDQAGLKKNARYIAFHCADTLEQTLDGSGLYYESIDLIDAFHPQTILAHSMNGAPLSVGHGAPVRMRVERQLGYKQAKYIMAMDVVSSLAGYGSGKGGYWEDRGYEWYAGI